MGISVGQTTGFVIVGTAHAQLSPEIMVDRHPVRAALAGMEAFIALQEKDDLGVPGEFDFKYAEVAIPAGRTGAAIDALNHYLMAVSRSAEFYRQALELRYVRFRGTD